MKKVLLSAILLGLFTIDGFSQSDRFWSSSSQSRSNIITDKAVSRQSFPQEFRLFDLNFVAFRNEAMSIVGRSSKSSTVITLPNTAGKLEQFQIIEASNFAPGLQAQFPEIRAYSGTSLTDPGSTLKMSVSPQGIQTMVFRGDNEDEFMEPYSADHKVYAVYSGRRQKGSMPWSCTTEDQAVISGLGKKVNSLHITNRNTGDLKTMRLAQSVTAEYSNYFGATSATQVGLVLAAINATLTRCNGVYEKDLALHLNLIDSTTKVIYYNPTTDPYANASTGAGGTWNNQLQTTLTSVIGDANYDIGHLFGASGGGGNAGCIGCVCNTGKGKGFTSPADGIPQGDNFDIDYVVHEVGHQLGANHTFSMSNEGSGVNKEPGSGITIMGYAGITSYNLAAHSIDIYHETSIDQIQTNLATKTCPITYAINNATPVVAPLTNYTIPKSTPFALTGSATDADGDPLTYCWEEDDNASSTQTNASSIASVTKASGPNWISFKPTTSPTRLFPQLSSILTGSQTTGPMAGGTSTVKTEALSSVARTLKFRLTVRDNHPFSSTPPYSVGQTQYADVTLTVNGTAGPFAVTNPNSAIVWSAGICQTVTWDVNGTNAAPINTSNVRIELSVDGGNTFPYILAASTANTGVAQVFVPAAISTTQGRIKVSAIDNIYFDISNANFSIIPVNHPQFSFSECATKNVAGCGSAPTSVDFNTNALVGFSTPITFTASGNPPGSTITFSPNPVVPGSPVNVTLLGAAAGSYVISITGTADTIVRSINANFDITSGAVAPTTTYPADGDLGVSITPTYTWAAQGGISSYTLEVADNAAFLTPMVYTNLTGTSYTPSTPLLQDVEYWWRVTPNGACGAGPVSAVAHFKTFLSACGAPEMSTDVPKTISASGAPLVTSTMTVSATGLITDVDVVGIQGTHTWVADLGFQIQHTTGTSSAASKLLNYACDDGNQYQNFDMNYDDEATSAVVPCPPTGGITIQPVSPLSVFDGMDASGTWTFRLKDTANQDGGSLNAWGLRICTAISNPFPVNWLSFTGKKNENNTVTLQWSTASEINSHHFEIERSLDGQSYTTIGNMKASNMANTVANYFFNDMKPYLGVNYYRLKQVDKDGKYQYSKVVSVIIDKSKVQFAVYPNPATSKSTVRVLSDINQLTIRLVDAVGKVAYQRTAGEVKAGQTFDIPVYGLSKGVYVLSLATESGTITEKVVVQ